MRELIKTQFNGVFNQPYVTSQTYPSKFYDEMFARENVLRLEDEDLKEARFLRE